jgi:hypothetical protein
MTGIGCSAQICNKTRKIVHLYHETGTYPSEHMSRNRYQTYVEKQVPNIPYVAKQVPVPYRTYVAKQVPVPNILKWCGRQLCRKNHLYAPFQATSLISVADPKFQLKTKLVLLPGSSIHTEVKRCIRNAQCGYERLHLAFQHLRVLHFVDR